jgi:magnesium-transporting ATPase (P-type)
VNLFTGSLPAIAFAFDEHMDREKYTGRDLKLIFTNEVKILTFGIGIFSSLLLFILYYWLLKIGIDNNVARSVFFVCFSSYILAVAFSFRSLKKSVFSFNPFSNRKLNLSLLIATFFLILTMTVPLIRDILHLAPLPVSWLPFILFWLVLNILLVEFAKYLMRHKHIFSKIFNFGHKK